MSQEPQTPVVLPLGEIVQMRESMARIESDLRNHIRRTDQNEKMIELLDQRVREIENFLGDMKRGLKWLALAVAAIAAGGGPAVQKITEMIVESFSGG